VLPFKIEVTKDLITSHAGLALLGEFAVGLGLLEALSQRIGAPARPNQTIPPMGQHHPRSSRSWFDVGCGNNHRSARSKVLDLALKVYVYYCKMPSPAKAESLIPRLNGAIDTPVLRHLFKKLEDTYGKSFPPHYLWTIKMIDKEDYDLLQKVIRQDIKDSFQDKLSPVQYDDVMGRRLDR
jgi:hypothetical protein